MKRWFTFAAAGVLAATAGAADKLESGLPPGTTSREAFRVIEVSSGRELAFPAPCHRKPLVLLFIRDELDRVADLALKLQQLAGNHRRNVRVGVIVMGDFSPELAQRLKQRIAEKRLSIPVYLLASEPGPGLGSYRINPEVKSTLLVYSGVCADHTVYATFVDVDESSFAGVEKAIVEVQATHHDIQ
jgi:hypothetical protein